MMLALSVPTADEECGIGMEPIAEYRLEWIPASVPHHLILDAPELTKAAIVGCGHGFNAVALLYHFLKNGMTCPFCRAGHKGMRMYWHLIPRHLREPMRQRLDMTRVTETRQQVEEDAVAALQFGGSAGVSAWQGRQVLLVYAYQSPEAASVFMTKEIVLESRRDLRDGALVLQPFLNNMTDLTRALRSAGLAATGSFEVVVATRDQHGCIMSLVRTGRFQTGMAPVCVEAPEGTVVRVGWSETGDMVGFDLRVQPSAIGMMA